MSAKILKFTSDAELKANLDAFDYDAYLAEMFKDLKHWNERAGYNGEIDLVCSFSIETTEWKRLKSKNLLGGLYNRDLSNFLYRKGLLKNSAIPAVNDKARASRGRKAIKVSFAVRI